MTRTVNVELLKAAIRERGNLGKEKLALETEVVSVDAINKIMSRRKAPLPLRMERLCEVLKVPLDVLFPVTGPKRKKSA